MSDPLTFLYTTVYRVQLDLAKIKVGACKTTINKVDFIEGRPLYQKVKKMRA